MRSVYLLSSFLSLLISFGSCDKKSEATTTKPKASIYGLWIGSYLDNSKTAQYFSFIVKPDGTLLVESRLNGAQQLGQGTWSLNGKTFTCNYSYFWGTQSPTNTRQTSTATFDENTGRLVSGVWQNTSPNSDTGTFSMSEVD